MQCSHLNPFQMSVLQLLTGLLDQHGDTAQQAALLAYLRQGEEAQPYLEVSLLLCAPTLFSAT